MNSRLLLAGAVCMGSFAAFAAAVTTEWKTSSLGATVAEASDFALGSNWEGDVAPVAPEDGIAGFSKFTGSLGFVKSDVPVSVGALQADHRESGTATPAVAFVSDAKLTLTPSSRQSKSIYYYCDIETPNGKPYLQGCDFCGDVTGAILPNGYIISHRFDLYAKEPGGVRTNGCVASVQSHSSTFRVYAPRSLAEAAASTWKVTKNSPYLFPVSVGHALPSGTAVSGDGIPSGAWLKRIFPDGSIEISAPATDDFESGSVVFAAQSSEVRIRMSEFRQGTVDGVYLSPCKYAEGDVLDLELDKLVSGSATYGRTAFNCVAGCVPGRVIIHDAASVPSRIDLGRCDLVFAENPSGEAGFPNTLVWMDGETIASRLSVEEGLTAKIGSMTKVLGTLTKAGTGTLVLPLVENVESNTGKIVVEEGVLEVVAADDALAYVKAIEVKSGAALRITGLGLAADEFTVEDGAVLEGPGALHAPSAVIARFTPGAQAAGCPTEAGTYGGYDAPEVSTGDPSDPLMGNPALWLAVDDGSTLETESADGKVYVKKWTDVRGAAYGFATNATLKPILVSTSAGEPTFVKFPFVSSSLAVPAETPTLFFDRRITGIRALFKVSLPSEAYSTGGTYGEQVLGGCYELQREAQRNATVQMFHSSFLNNNPLLTTAKLYFNGVFTPIDTETAYPYNGFRSESTPPAECVPVVLNINMMSPGVGADNLASNNGGGRHGGQKLYECLIYTNEVTEAQRLAITGYLMKKYLNAEVNYETVPGGRLDPSALKAGLRLDVASGRSLNVPSAGTSAGTFAKGGAGTLYVDDFADAERSLEVAGGTLVLRSVEVGLDALPAGAYVHYDASDETKFVRQASNPARITTLKDVRGDGYVAAKALYEGWNPKVMTDSACGRTMMGGDGLSQTSSKSQYCLWYPTCYDVRSVFYVTDSEKGAGAYLLGSCPYAPEANTREWNPPTSRGPWALTQTYDANDHLNGIGRTHWSGQTSNPLISISGSKAITRFAPGASRGTLNGVAADFTTTGFTGTGVDVASLVTYESVEGSAIAAKLSSGDYPVTGGNYFGETVVYRTALSSANAAIVDAYLRKKWRGEETPGYRPAAMDRLTVAAGATLDVYGNAPVAVKALAVAGAVNGSVELAEGAELTLTVADGAVQAVSVSGGLDLSKGGTVVFAGADKRGLKAGEYILCDAASDVVGAWTFERIRKLDMAFFVRDGKVVLSVRGPGLTVILR